MLLALLGGHLAAAAAAGVLTRRLGPRAFLVAALAPLATVVLLFARAGDVLHGDDIAERVSWVPSLGLSLDLRLDAFALLMVALVSGIGVLVFVYAWRYFSPRLGLGRFVATLTVFAGSMLGLVLADDVFVLYVFWELTSITSYLLIGYEDDKAPARAAALQALLTTGAGGLVMLGGLVLLAQEAGTSSLSGILADPPTTATAKAGLALVLLGPLTKSAQVPFHTWLPGAMAAPTPVSAYLHSATMVKAGVYLIARLAPAFAPVVGFWRPVVVGAGVATMLVGGWRALRQHDLKLLLAFGTVSQLGFMVALLGAGIAELTAAGTLLLLAHGVFKAALFMAVGVVDHQAHSRDLRRLSGIGARMPVLAVASVAAAASMVGLPPFVGFIAKEAGYEALLHSELPAWLGPAALAGIVTGSILTFAYGARFVWGAFARKDRRADELVDPASVKRPDAWFAGPAVLLGGLGLLAGLVPMLVEPLVAEAAHALDPEVDLHGLALWHGLNVALALSAVTVGAGIVLFVFRERVERFQSRFGPLPSASGAYQSLLAGTLRFADRVTGIVQNGSLPVYLMVILATVLVLPGTVVLTQTRMPGGIVFAESVVQVVAAAVAVAGAIAAVRATRRFAAVLFLGAVGYSVAVLFVVQGAPDLALTQFLVETLSLVIFVLVLRHLPDRFTARTPPLGSVVRVVVSFGVGVFVTVFALVAAAARTAAPVSGEYVERALPEGHGRNIVNVILVDFRGFDTLGEITVLAVAALGVISLVMSGRRDEA